MVDTIERQSGMLDNFAGMIGSSNAPAYAEGDRACSARCSAARINRCWPA
jgi:hypothetical protein